MTIGAAPEQEVAPAPQPIEPFLVQCTVAAVGLDKFLDQTFRRLHLYHVEDAARVPDTIDRRLYQFLGRAEFADPKDLPPFDFDAVRDVVKTAPAPNHVADVIAGFGEHHELGLACVRFAETAQQYLRANLPVRARQTLAGAAEDVPQHSEVARFRRTWVVACDPMRLLDDLDANCLARGMVQACRDLYPLVWDRFDRHEDPQAGIEAAGLTPQIHRKLSAQPGYQITVRKDQLLRVLTQQEDAGSRALSSALQAVYAAQQPAQVPPAKPGKKTAGSIVESSAADRIGEP